VDRIERYIKRKLAAAVRGGFGQWVDSPESALGKPIYHVTDGPMTLVLSQMGFIYDGVAPQHFECRYDEVEALNWVTLPELSRGKYHGKMLTIGVILRGVPTRHDLQLSANVYCNVVAPLWWIVRYPPGSRPGDDGYPV